MPIDWSHRHLVMSAGPVTPQLAMAASREPRIMAAMLRRALRHNLVANLANQNSASALSQLRSIAAARRDSKGKHNPKGQTSNITVDWSTADLLAAPANGTFPAVFVSDFSAPSTTDWMVFGLNVAGGASQPNLVGLSCLETGLGGCTAPTLKFSFRLTNTVRTSPVISLDGTKVLVIDGTTGGGGTLNVRVICVSDACLSGGRGTLAAPIVPPSETILAYTAAGDTQSSPWVDYTNDIAYFISDDNRVHQITGVFNGTPTLNPGALWPFNAGAGASPGTSPVLDLGAGSTGSGKLFWGGNDGKLHSLACSTTCTNGLATATAVTQVLSAQVAATASIDDGPIVDTGNARAYVFTFDNNAATPQPVMAQFSTAFTTGAAALNTATLMLGTTGNNNTNPIRIGSFDDAFFSSGSGAMWVCGNTRNPGAPLANGIYSTLMRFPVNGGTLTTTPSASLIVSRTAADACSAVTEFLTTVSVSGTPELQDTFYVGTTTSDIVGSTTCTHGCVQSFYLNGGTITRLAAADQNGLSTGIVVDVANTQGTPSCSSGTTANASILFVRQGVATGVGVPTRRAAVGLTQCQLQ